MNRYQLLISLIVLLTAASVEAGDPCPIPYRLTDLGPLYWSKSKGLKKDKVFNALVAHAKKQDCTVFRSRRTHREITLGKGKDAPYLDIVTLQNLLVGEKKAFRCEDAHVALAALKALKDGYHGEIYYQRGRRRVMLVSPGWGTACATLADLQDKQKGPAAIKAIWDKASKGWADFRHANP